MAGIVDLTGMPTVNVLSALGENKSPAYGNCGCVCYVQANESMQYQLVWWTYGC